MNRFELDCTIISRILADRGHQVPEPVEYPEGYFSAPPEPASVLIPLFRDIDGWRVLYIRRSEHEADRHSGQVAFPGGKLDAVDRDAHDAALREAQEEIGLDPEHVSILGNLKSYRTISNYLVTPVVAEINWPVPLVLDSREVSRVFIIPVTWLADPANHQISRRALNNADASVQVIHFQRYEGELLWGITAKLTVSLLNLIGLLDARR
ncbi:NUDIX hydrolase [Sedimenticola selenatireducens]|uniref:CoA pyrophosphatase n=1 Tax=Sedimenticola selenatireducens TaxID=191960 RepID=A0A2N6CZU6_9GAMM|nr:CoA pyrophosphatase [Sedimenticola selenatireducens]PLX62938.1 MAG: CoA pyrophosphatase [Sedimenticola selenatireducens]